MDPADVTGLPMLFGLLSEATLAGSAAVLLVLALRRPLRHAFGAVVAYAAWALVPAAVVAVALPAETETVVAAPVAVLASTAVAPLTTVPAASSFDVAPWLLALWLAGAVVMMVRLGRQQRAFRRGLGRLRPRTDGLLQAETVAGLPAALGILRPAIVVPADFDARYSREERELMHAHERSHIVRGDLHLNALVAGLRSVFWFNPLLHHAVRQFRHDQELACDQRVIARHPHGRRAYGEAMFKTQLASQPLPLGCHWAAFDRDRSHPLTERIAMLKQPMPTAARWIGGGTLVLVLALGVGFAAWSAQPKREVVGSNPLAVEAMAPTPSAYRIENGIALDSMVTAATPKAPPAPPAAMPAPAPAPPASPAPPSSMALPTPPALPAAMDPPPPPRMLSPPKGRLAPLPPLPPAASPAPPASTAPAAPHAGDGPTPLAAPLPPIMGNVNRTPAPKYPAGALAQQVGGKVVLEIDIDATGKPVDVEVVASEPAGVFDQTAVDAARAWQFKPEIRDGKAVPGRVRVPVEFAPTPPSTEEG